jgi:amino acid adenylation domain-containing protein/non-ribosomal peptide synthase protein (TIGR01720 family)
MIPIINNGEYIMNNFKVTDILQKAYDAGVHLWVENEQLKFRVKNKKDMTEELLILLKNHKNKLVDFLYANMNNEFNTPLVKAAKGRSIVATPIQKQLWFMQNLSEEGGLYNISFIIKISGAFIKEKIIEAINHVVLKHESLRTYFQEYNGILLQKIIDKPNININYFDLTLQNNTVDKLKLSNVQIHSSFNLGMCPLFKITLFKLSEKNAELLLTIHHSIADGKSINIIYCDLVEFYANKYKIFVYENKLQFSDFSVWHHEYAKSIKNKQLAYWKDILADDIPILELCFDYSRRAHQTFAGNNFSFSLGTCRNKLNKLHQINPQITVFNVFFTIYAIFLYRYSMQTTIIIGIPITQRRMKEFEDTVGMFANSLPIKLQFNPKQTFMETLTQVNALIIESQLNSDVYLDEIIDSIALPRSSGYSPLFQTMFMLDEETKTIECDNLKFSLLGIETNTAKFDITLAIKVQDDGNISGIFEFNTALFKGDTIRLMAESFALLCQGVLENPHDKINKYALLSNLEEDYRINQINSTHHDFEQDIKLHQLFEKQVDLDPNAIAVVCDSAILSYHELNQKANTLARQLQNNGVSKQDTVAILLPRSIDAIVTLLAILKLGAIFIPLDIEYPNKRIQYSIFDAKCKLVITYNNLIHKLGDFKEICYAIEQHRFELDPTKNGNLTNTCDMDDLAYIIYTSGSTGNPKGVMIHHLGISHYIQWAIRYYKVQSGSGAPVHSSLAFDLTITSIFAPLCCGKTVFVIPDEFGLQGLIDLLYTRQDFSLIKLTPAHLKRLQSMIDVDILQKLHASVVIGGEALFKDDLKYWRDHGKNMRFINEYGATETSVADTVYELSVILPETASIPVGKAIDNSQMYVLDSNLKPLPYGIVGEIYLSGIGLAKGYLNLPEKTAEKFLPHPFLKNKNEKIYKTGDLGKLLSDGNVVFVGRIDHQVKIKGFRVELGEIEAVMDNCNLIKQSVLKVWQNEQNENYIAAYVISENVGVRIQDIRDYLKKYLPIYMVPSAFVELKDIPLTINGKIDTNALLKPTHNDFIIKNEYIAPSNDKEMLICKILAELFKVEQISIYDNFFALGGDSILSIQFISRLQSNGWLLTTKQLFKSQTVIELAKIIQKTVKNIIAEQGILIGECPLLPAQQWALKQNFLDFNHFNQSFIMVSNGKIDNKKLVIAILKLLEHHDALRLSFKNNIQCYNNIVDVERSIIFIELPLSTLAVQLSLITKYCNQYQEILNFRNGDNTKFIHFTNLVDNNDRVAIIIHHWVVDGVSWRIIFEDLNALYKDDTLPNKTSSCRDWLLYLDKNLHMFDTWRENQYWKNITLRQAYLFPEVQSMSYANYMQASWCISSDETSTLLFQANGSLGTSMMPTYLLYSLMCALRDQFSNNNFLIEIEGHGRDGLFDEIDISRTVGWFTTQYPVNLEIGNDPIVMELAKLRANLNSIPKNGFLYNYMMKNALGVNKNINEVNPKIGFNYLGQFNNNHDNYFAVSNNNSGVEISDKNQGWHLIMVTAWVMDHQLYLDVKAHPSIFTNKLFKIFIDKIKGGLNSVIRLEQLNDYNLLEVYEATHTQKFMWDHSKKQLEAYKTTISWELLCDHISYYKEAWANFILEYPILNSQFIELNNMLYQVVYGGKIHLGVAKGDYQHISFMKINHNRYKVTWKYHHALLDGWSIPLILERINQIYIELLDNTYKFQKQIYDQSSYFNWQKLNNEKLAETFWQEAVATLNIENKYLEEKNLIKPNWQVNYEELPLFLVKKLKSFSSLSGITIASILQFSWLKALSKFKNTTNPCVATLASGRHAEIPQVERVIGMLLEIFPVVWNIEGQSLIEELKLFNNYLNKCIEFGYYDWQSLYKIKFDSLFVYENFKNSEHVMNLQVKSRSHIPLVFIGLPKKENLDVAIEYDSNVYKNEDIKNLLSETINSIYALLDEDKVYNSTLNVNDLIVTHNETESGTPIFWVHPGSAGAEIYSKFVKLFPKEQALYLIDSYNLNTSHEYLTSIKDMASLYIKLIKLKQPYGPYILGGWSLGGLIAYEIVNQLTHNGDDVHHLFLIDSLLIPDNIVDSGSYLNRLMQDKFDSVLSSGVFEKDVFAKHREVAEIESKAIANYIPKEKNLVKSTLYKAKYERPLYNKVDSKLVEFLSKINLLSNNGWENGLSNLQTMLLDADHYSIMTNNAVISVVNDVINTMGMK